MNVRHLSPRLASSPEKNFDINLKINFQSGHVSLAIPQNFKKKQQMNVQEKMSICYQPPRHIYSLPISQIQRQHFSPNYQKQSVAETINVVDCVICGKSYAQNQFAGHLQFHRQRKSELQSRPRSKQQSQHDRTVHTTLRSASQYTFQPQRQRQANSFSGSIPQICEMEMNSANYAMLEYSQSSNGFRFKDVRSINSNVHYLSDHIFSQQNKNSRSSMNSQPISVNSYSNVVINSNIAKIPQGQNKCQQTNNQKINLSYRTYSVPDPREFQISRMQQFNPLQVSHISYSQSLGNNFQRGLFPTTNQKCIQSFNNQMQRTSNMIHYQNLAHEHCLKQNAVGSYQRGGIHRIAALKNNLKAQSKHMSESHDNELPSNTQMINFSSLSAQISPKRSAVESQLNHSINSQANLMHSKKRPQFLLNHKKTEKMQNTLYNSFKNKEDTQSQDDEGGFNLQKSKPILQRLSSNDFKSLKLGQSDVSQISEKSKSSKTKIPVNYLARQEFIQSSVTNSSCN